jgi:hypothetical protein
MLSTVITKPILDTIISEDLFREEILKHKKFTDLLLENEFIALLRNCLNWISVRKSEENEVDKSSSELSYDTFAFSYDYFDKERKNPVEFPRMTRVFDLEFMSLKKDAEVRRNYNDITNDVIEKIMRGMEEDEFESSEDHEEDEDLLDEMEKLKKGKKCDKCHLHKK